MKMIERACRVKRTKQYVKTITKDYGRKTRG